MGVGILPKLTDLEDDAKHSLGVRLSVCGREGPSRLRPLISWTRLAALPRARPRRPEPPQPSRTTSKTP
jgi:hypothetical protein